MESKKIKLKERNYSIDYVKLIACISVVAVHFRLNLIELIPLDTFGPTTSLSMAIIYQIFITCVPLFLISTGFLTYGKSYNISYYKKIVKFFSLYVLCSLVTYFMLNQFFGKMLPILDIVKAIEFYKLIPYSWYIEMYLGFALLIPFLSLLMERLDKKEAFYFLVTLLTLVSLPLMVNSNPKLNLYVHLPASWTSLFPFVYYVLGAILKKYYYKIELKFNQVTFLMVVYFLAILLGVYINYINATPMVGGAEGGYGSLIIVVQSTSLFLLIYYFFKSKNSFVANVSKLTLPIYLMSYLGDQIVYRFFMNIFDNPKSLFFFFVPIILCVFFLSLLFAFVVNYTNDFIFYYMNKLLKRNFKNIKLDKLD